jgi:hypothetical protein
MVAYYFGLVAFALFGMLTLYCFWHFSRQIGKGLETETARRVSQIDALRQAFCNEAKKREDLALAAFKDIALLRNDIALLDRLVNGLKAGSSPELLKRLDALALDVEALDDEFIRFQAQLQERDKLLVSAFSSPVSSN